MFLFYGVDLFYVLLYVVFYVCMSRDIYVRVFCFLVMIVWLFLFFFRQIQWDFFIWESLGDDVSFEYEVEMDLGILIYDENFMKVSVVYIYVF